mmetsp:Transcript_14558/g.28683  ORF Transcript_14558/g.28683 Transcript_14558/m.28683 type:complete len:298 (-) Transcript_14558:142-1035(-)|eukprot:CAMPEP_0172699490 /NCGR_PEP_ID=MMETSP1074-20121228/30224_1 /TAXON_ID=2916 /ORGANISM="Ceratium fusus, Strain PA161109" /LENGTH=297 /DNA_ID=CAMNT_0013520703 /DNA_START=33 /DNA_END=926 /DNA_ORIENTATION=-
MAHRAGTADAPIPGLITSRRNPAYRLKPKPKEHAGASTQPSAAKVREALRAGQAAAQRRKRSPSRSSADRSPDAEQREKKRKDLEDKVQQEREDAEAQRRKREEEEAQRRRWAEQEARWAEERRLREEQRRVEEERQAQRTKKLKGAFAVDDEEDGEANDEQRAKELAEHQRRRAAAVAKAAPALLPPPPGESSSALGTVSLAALPRPASASASTSTSITAANPEDAVRLRASLADPAAPRLHAPGEVAEHFRRLSEMKRRFRRAEFGGPDKRREPSRSRSRDPDKYNSVWIRSGRA